MSDVTRILAQIDSGDPAAAEQLLPLVYDELRKLAAARLAREKPGQTLQATALVHEAWLRLVPPASGQKWQGKEHFYVVAAESMRRILVDSARRKSAAKRGGNPQRESLDEALLATSRKPEEILEVHEALDALAAEDSQAAELVKLHYFGGLAIEEAAELVGLSRASAYRRWTFARAWLRAHVSRSENP